jgi:endonuclease YncB( thermonuclease family)
MSKVEIFWDPKGFELDSIGANRFERASDGDTPYVSIAIRMLSIDTPELHYPGNAKPSNQNEKLAMLAEWFQEGKAPITDDLAAILHPRLVTGEAGTLQERQGKQAKDEFSRIVTERITKPNGKQRNIFLCAADEHFDQYGRLLAYIAPVYTPEEIDSMSRWERMTFNLQMLHEGWAAPMPIYPSLPKHSDLVMLQEAGKLAFDEKRGIWAEPLMLTGYEFRMCVKLFEVTEKLTSGKTLSSAEKHGWISRYCVDMTTREIFYPEEYHKVAPYNRIFIWPDNVTEAVGRLNLIAG